MSVLGWVTTAIAVQQQNRPCDAKLWYLMGQHLKPAESRRSAGPSSSESRSPGEASWVVLRVQCRTSCQWSRLGEQKYWYRH